MIGEGRVGQAIAAAMSCPFGVGQSLYRYAGDVPNIQSLGNAVYPLALLKRFLPFDRQIGKGEDWELHYRMRQEGVRLAQFADIHYEFHARPTLGSLWRQQFGYAQAKINIVRKHSLRAVRLTHFVPLAMVLWVLLGLVAAAYVPALRLVWAAPIVAYLVASLIFSIRSAPRHGWAFLWLLPIVFLCMHFAYGLGMLWGILSRPGDSLRKATR